MWSRIIDRAQRKAPTRLDAVFGFRGGNRRYVRKITRKVIRKGSKRLIKEKRVWKSVWIIRLSDKRDWKKFNPILASVAKMASSKKNPKRINERKLITCCGRIFSAGKMIPNPRCMEVKIKPAAQSRLIKPKIPMAAVLTLRRPIFTSKSLSRFSFILFRKAKKLTEISG